MQNFKVILKKENQKKYNLISWIILFVNAVCLFLFSASTGFKNIGPAIAGAVVILIVILIRYLKSPNEKMAFWFPLFLCSAAWLKINYWWISILDLVFLILGLLAAKDLIIYFSDKEIKYASLFNRVFSWTEISHAILKDDMLTIDFKNNKIIQQQVDEQSSSLNEKEFNDFCNKQLTLSNQK